MKKDTVKTPVFFYLEAEPENVLAVFVGEDDKHPHGGYTCYSHIGQHSTGAPSYYLQLRQATKEQYSPLAEELQSIGYNLEILNKA